MKLLVSDYDGTLFENIKGLLANIEVIKEYMNKGNHFAISTGRSYDSIKSCIDKYHIPYNYVFCNDGLVCYDNKNNIIYSNNISNNDCEKLISYLNNKYKIKLYDSFGASNNINSIIEILVFNSFNRYTDFEYDLFKNLPEFKNKLFFTLLKQHCFIRPLGNKSLGLETMLNITSINYDKIITVGNDSNDLELLKDFNGYKVLYSYPTLYFKNIKTIKDVKTLVKKIY